MQQLCSCGSKKPDTLETTYAVDQTWQITCDESCTYESTSQCPRHCSSAGAASEGAVPSVDDPLQVFMSLDNTDAGYEEQDGCVEQHPAQLVLYDLATPSVGSQGLSQSVSDSKIPVLPHLWVETLFTNRQHPPTKFATDQPLSLLGRPVLSSMPHQPADATIPCGLLRLPVYTAQAAPQQPLATSTVDGLFADLSGDLQAAGQQSTPGRMLLPSSFVLTSSTAISSDEQQPGATPAVEPLRVTA